MAGHRLNWQQQGTALHQMRNHRLLVGSVGTVAEWYPYASAHLPKADSEIVGAAEHSEVHRHALGVQVVRRTFAGALRANVGPCP